MNEHFRPSPFIVAPNHSMAAMIAKEKGFSSWGWNYVGKDAYRIRGYRSPKVIVYLEPLKACDWWPETRAYIMHTNPDIEIYRENFRGYPT